MGLGYGEGGGGERVEWRDVPLLLSRYGLLDFGCFGGHDRT